MTFPTLSPAATCTWQGTTSDTWSTSTNWSCTASATSPSSTDDAVIDTNKTVDLGISAVVNQLTMANSGAILSGSGDISSTNDFDLQAGTINAILSGSSGLIKTTASTVTLSGANTYTGSTQISEGSLVLGSSDVLADSSSLIINGGTLAMGANNDTVTGMQMQSGLITGTGNLTISGASNWSGGTENGTGITNFNGALSISGDSTKTISGNRVINTAAITTWGGNTVNAANQIQVSGSTINNSGTWNDTNNFATVFDAISGSNVFNNTGTYNKQGNGTTTIESTFNNTGTVNVQTGTLSLNGGGSSDASFNIASGATLEFGGGIHNLNNISTAGNGRFQINGSADGTGSNAILNSPTSHTGELSIVGGTFTVDGNFTVASFSQSNGILTGTSTTTINGTSTWTGGAESGTGITHFNGALSISGDSTKTISGSRVINTAAITTWGGNTASNANQIQVSGSTINNSGTWNDTNNFATVFDAISGINVFNNTGTYNKQGNSTTTIESAFNNTGTVNVQTGSLSLNGGGNSGASFNIANGATLEFGGGIHNLNNISTAGNGRLQINGSADGTGSNTILSSPTSHTGELSIVGGTFTVDGNFTAASFSQSNGILAGTSTTTSNGTSTWTGGTESGTGITHFNGALSISGDSTKTISGNRVINTAAITTWGGNTASNANQIQVSGSTINNSGTWNDTNNFATVFDAISGSNVFNNTGTYSKQGNGTTTIESAFNNTGTVNVQTGTLSLNGGGSSDANFNSANGATLEFGGGSHTFNLGTNIIASNLLFSGGINQLDAGANLTAIDAVFSGGTSNILGDYISGSTTVDGGIVKFLSSSINLGTTFTINGGTVTLQPASTEVEHYTQTGGTLSGPGDLHVKSATLSGGEMGGTGRLIIKSSGSGSVTGNSSLSISNNFILNNQSIVINSGNVKLLDSASFIGTGSYRQTSGTTQVDGTWNQALTEIQAGSFGGNGTVGGQLINDGTVGIAASNLHLSGPLSGTGSYAGAVTINNSFSPGPGPDGLGIATINATTADLILSPTSSLNLEFGGNLNGQLVSDSISAGNIDIQGAQLNLLRLTDQPNFTPSQAFAQVTLLQTTGSISGNFNENVSCPEGSSDLFVLSKQQQQFLLTVVPKLPSLVPADVQSLANALQQIDCSPSTPASLQNLVNGLKPFLENGTADTNKVDQFINALRQISPGQIAVEQNVSSQITKLQTANVGQRLTSVRALSAGGSAPPSGINVSSSVSAPVAASPSSTPTSSSPTSAAPSTPSKDSSSPATAPSSASFAFSTDGDGGNPELGPGFSNLGLFINGQFEWAERSSTLIQRGYRSTLSAVTAGADYRLSQRLLVGLSAGYGSSEVTVSQKGGGQSVDGYTLSAYSSLNLTDNWYVDLVNNLTYNQYASKRVTLYTDAQSKAIEQTAQSQTDGWQNRTSISSGYDFSLSEWTLGVRGRTEYGYSFVNGRREQGADLGLNMIVGELNNESLTSSLGAMVSHALSTPIGVLISQVNVEWEHQWFNKNSLITTRFVDAPNNPFTTDSFSIDKDYVNVRAGVSAQLPFGGSAFIQYDTTLGQQYITRHAFNVGVRIEF